MTDELQTSIIIKAIWVMVWTVVASYYFSWGENEKTVTDPVDESGWTECGEYAKMISGNARLVRQEGYTAVNRPTPFGDNLAIHFLTSITMIYAFGALCMFFVTLLSRALYLIFFRNGSIPKTHSRHRPVRTMIILGSGGHTSEMLRIVEEMKSPRYSPRIYVRACTDSISASKVEELEGDATDYQLLNIRRCREVHQPYLASVWTTIFAILDSFPIVWIQNPDLILCNGPGTCVPLCIVAFLYKLVFLTDVRVVFVESYCRVKTLSLSGRILYRLADFVIVRWKSLNSSLYPRTVCL